MFAKEKQTCGMMLKQKDNHMPSVSTSNVIIGHRVARLWKVAIN